MPDLSEIYESPKLGGNETQNCILFELAGTTYAIPSASVLHIDMLEHLTLVPNAHTAIDGVVFSRGKVIPILNLRTRFGFPRQETTIRTRVVFILIQERVVGLLVDSAREFRTFSAASIRSIDATLTGVRGNYLTGVAKLGGRLVMLLDLEAVLDLDQDLSLVNSLAAVADTSTAETVSAMPPV